MHSGVHIFLSFHSHKHRSAYPSSLLLTTLHTSPTLPGTHCEDGLGENVTARCAFEDCLAFINTSLMFCICEQHSLMRSCILLLITCVQIQIHCKLFHITFLLSTHADPDAVLLHERARAQATERDVLHMERGELGELS